MRARGLTAAAGLGLLLSPLAVIRGEDPPVYRLPPLEAGPALSERSERTASYTMQARLDPEAHTVTGEMVLEWRNTASTPVGTFPFHLYWNAFRNNLSTSARGQGRRAARAGARATRERGYGYTEVTSVRLLGATEVDLTPTLRYVAPDDGNADDRTLMEVDAPSPVPPGGTARFRIAWQSQIPYGDVGRAGWVHDYHFIVQWFPKIAAQWKGQWDRHQFHSWAEFFANFGVYDVSLTLPRGFVVGSTGRLQERKANPDGSETLRFVQEDVHDFAWTASRRFLERTARFADPGYPPVDIRLLLQPEHAHLAERYLEATRIALRTYGAWSAPYPYPQITVVDPAWSSASGGMEYPTLFTGGASIWSPPALHSPEGVTIHEAGHQFWYGLVGNNEFEEAWLDEGFNSYHDEKAEHLALGPVGMGTRYFGLRAAGRGRSGWPVVAPGVFIGRGEGTLSSLRRHGQSDPMTRRGWEYRSSDSYTLNSYGKPALSLQTLEGLVGDDTMTRIMRAYAARYRFGHPTSEDFIAVVNEVTGQDYRWFFDETWFSSELCDYTVTARNQPARVLAGFTDGPRGGLPVPAPRASDAGGGEKGPFDSEVTVRRLGGVRLPVEVLVEFGDGRRQAERWDGKDRWTRFRYHGPAKVRRVVVDPERRLALDVNPANNSWVDDAEKAAARRAARKWAARWMFWLQNLLELHTVLG